MLNVERIIGVDVAVRCFAEVVEDVGLEGVGRFHYEGVEIEPPEPDSPLAFRSNRFGRRV